MPLLDPWIKRSPPLSSSPLRRVPSPLSLRTRNRARLGLVLITIVLAACALNELVCMNHRCISHVAFSSGSRGEAGGGATLPEDWKYRLGEQLKLNMQSMAQPQAPAEPPNSPKEDQIQEKMQHAHEKAPTPNGALVDPFPITHNADAVLSGVTDNRWIDAPPSPLSSDRGVSAQMSADKDVYLSGQELDAPPPKSKPPPVEAPRHRPTKLPSNDNRPQPTNNTSAVAFRPDNSATEATTLSSSANTAAPSSTNANAATRPKPVAPSDPTTAFHDTSLPSTPLVSTKLASPRPKKPSSRPHDAASSGIESSNLALGSADIGALRDGSKALVSLYHD